MPLSLPSMAFVRMLQLLQPRGTDQDDLAVEAVVLRPELAVLRRKSSVRWAGDGT
jgi:hypothetical protein